jgi:simple sugar transport system permease protein
MTALAATRARRRLDLGALAPLAVSVAVAVVAGAVCLLVIGLTGNSIADTASAFVDGAFGGEDAVGDTIAVMIPLVLLGLAWIVASSGRQINLGLEGQILAGGIGTTVVGTNFDGLASPLHIALCVLAGGVCGALWAAVPALLWVWRDVSVLLSSFMLNFVAVLLVAWLVRGPLQNPGPLGIVESRPVALSAVWPLVGSGSLRWDWVLIPIAVIALVVVQRWTTTGFRLRVISANESAARHAGMATTRIGAVAVMTSGAMAGIAGSSLILGSFTGTLKEGFSSGYGFIGIAVALLARNNPIGCVASALLFAALQQGGALVETRVGVSSASVDLAEGLVILFMAGSTWLLVKLTGHRRAAAELAPEGPVGTV